MKRLLIDFYHCQAENIPQKFLEQILIDLRHAGMIASKRGYGGGHYLIKTKGYQCGHVYRLFDRAIALVPFASP